MKRDIIDSLLIGLLLTYLPFWQFESVFQRICAVPMLSMLAFAGILAIKN